MCLSRRDGKNVRTHANVRTVLVVLPSYHGSF